MLLDATLWVVCGAGRGVGKTHLANRLCEILPDATYAKLGHGSRSPEKHPNFFQDADELWEFLQNRDTGGQHFVVEANDASLREKADIVIYIDNIPDHTDVREDADQMRRSADICVNAEGPDNPTTALEAEVADRELCDQIKEILQRQSEFLTAGRPSVRTKVWFEVGGRRTFGPGLAHLLDGVQNSGSLRAAAEAAGMSYRHAWDLIHAAEDRFGKSLLEGHSGGTGGGGSELTSAGEAMLRIFRRLNQQVARFADEKYDILYDQIMEERIDDSAR